jgi:hypothetical protein
MGSSDSPVTPKLAGFALFWMGTHLHRGRGIGASIGGCGIGASIGGCGIGASSREAGVLAIGLSGWSG